MRRYPVFEQLAIEIRALRESRPREYTPMLEGTWLRDTRGRYQLDEGPQWAEWRGFPVAIETVNGNGEVTIGIETHLWICREHLRLVRRMIHEYTGPKRIAARYISLASIDEIGGARELARLCVGYRLNAERVLAAVRDEAHRHRRLQSSADGAPLAAAS